MGKNKSLTLTAVTLALLLVIGQLAAYFAAPDSWQGFTSRLPVILAMVFYWGPICAIFSALFVSLVLRLLGFTSLDEIRRESVEENNPTPAILFVGSLIASVLFLLLVIRP